MVSGDGEALGDAPLIVFSLPNHGLRLTRQRCGAVGERQHAGAGQCLGKGLGNELIISLSPSEYRLEVKEAQRAIFNAAYNYVKAKRWRLLAELLALSNLLQSHEATPGELSTDNHSVQSQLTLRS